MTSSYDNSPLTSDTEEVTTMSVSQSTRKRTMRKSVDGTTHRVETVETSHESVLVKRGKEETSSCRKFWIRLIFGWLMIFAVTGIVLMGHLYVSLMVIFMQCLLFSELIRVRYSEKKSKEIPLFRTLQWSIFSASMFFTYGDGLVSFLARFTHHPDSIELWFIRYHALISFLMYSFLFVVVVLSMKKGYYRYQMSQLTWTVVTIALIVIQMRQITNTIFSGLFWMLFPASLIVCNDTTAYIWGVLLGRKIIKRPFLKLSPNKTWEGFVGGMVCTVLFALISCVLFSNFKWLICPIEELSLWPHWLDCKPHYVFEYHPYDVLELLQLSSFLPTYANQGFVIYLMPAQLHGIALALYASLVAPFGGFFASAIKRAYRIKDFEGYIPGHGGVMDRMDCQLLMALCTAVHVNTFVKTVDVSVVLALLHRMELKDKILVLDRLKDMIE